MQPLEGMYVLVIDDHEDTLDMTRYALEHDGAFVKTASSAADAMLHIWTVMPHVIITDISMPGMDGYGLLAELQKSPQWREIPVIALTGTGRAGDDVTARAAGFSEYLLKPVDHSALVAAILRLAKKP